MQPIVKDTSFKIGNYHVQGEQFVLCGKCQREVNLKYSYFDVNCKGGMQVHYECLSDDRKS